MQYILYLHGFHSSPNSIKANIFKQQVNKFFPEIDVICPQLPCLPEGFEQLLASLCQQYKFIGAVGSSLGGYLATHLHNKYDFPVVLVNPAVKPYELLQDYLGPQIQPMTQEKYVLQERDMGILKQLDCVNLKAPENIWLLQQEDDEVLDFRQALHKYQQCKITFELGGCHGFDGFERFPIDIVNFFIAKNITLSLPTT